MTFASHEATQKTPSSNISAEPTTVLAWTVHLGRQRPIAFLRVAACVAFTFVCGAFVFHSALLALLPAAALLLSVSEYWLPVRYSLNAKGASAKWGLMALEIPWTDVRHAYLTTDGIKLSPLRVKGSRVESLRGVFVRFGDNKDAVVEAVRVLRGKAGSNA